MHPMFWTAEERLTFLTAASDRVELEDREDNSSVLGAMEAVGARALSGSWDEKLDSVLLENLGKYRRYNYWSVRDLLRVIRNKSNHYRELPQNVKVCYWFLGALILTSWFFSYFSLLRVGCAGFVRPSSGRLYDVLHNKVPPFGH